ncbi:glycosyltransferase [Crocinitomix catalasitica]|nr:glycosyltransferase [Crocinitomix catalasitica]
MAKKKILICIDWYEPGFKAGGPIKSVAHIVSALKDKFEFYIMTSAYDLGETEPYKNVELDTWLDRDDVFIKYMSKKSLTSAAIKGNIHEILPDVIYLNSLFSKLFTLAPLRVARRRKIGVILAPRGMLGKGALEIKAAKKKIFLTVCKLIGFYGKITWHASTVEEESEIKKEFGSKADIVIAQNIPMSQKLELDDILNRKQTGDIRFVFISRVARKKNLHLAIDCLKKCKTKANVLFDIYGNIEEQEYFDSFKDDLKDHGNVKIEYKGVLRPSEIPEVYANSDFLLLPTMHENYGHAIVEAWSNGCPVIISTNTPWKNLRVQELGWDVDISDPGNLTNALQEGIDLDFTTYIAMVRSSYNYFSTEISESEVIAENQKLFENAN